MTQSGTTPPAILIVEDSPLHARIMMTMLSDIGIPDYKVTAVPQLRDALVMIDNWGPDLILLDLHLPDAEGTKAVESVVNAAPNVPVIVVSAHDDPKIALAVVEAGAKEFMSKWPANSDAFASLVRLALARSQTQSQDSATPAAS